MTDPHLSELIRQCANATPFQRLNTTEQAEVFAWLFDGDDAHATRTGKPLQRPRQQPAPISYTGDGQPIFAKAADFSPTETVEMPKADTGANPEPSQRLREAT